LSQVKDQIKKIIPRKLWAFLKSIFRTDQLKQIARERLIASWTAEKSSSNRRQQYFNQKPGLNLIGDFTAANGLGEAARSSLVAIQTTTVPFAVLNYQSVVPEHQRFDFQMGSYETRFAYKINLFHVNPLEFPSLWHEFPHYDLADHYAVGSWYWELPEFPEKWTSTLDLVDEVWVASDFVKDSIQKKTQKPVIKIPPCIHVEFDPTINRASLKLPEDKFLFLCAFDVLSMQERKNPWAVIEAFKRSFSPKENSVGLVVKINNAVENQEKVAELKRALSEYSNCYFIEETFPRLKFNSLINLIDVYVSLHRSEGFGLIPAEAMYLGKPVIMTNWSGNTEFMTDDNCCPVNYNLIPLAKNYGDYEANQIWADPDIDHAAMYMKRLSSDRAYVEQISSNASVFIRSHYSPEAVGRLIAKRVEEIDRIRGKMSLDQIKEEI